MVISCVRDPELLEDRTHVGFDGSFGQEELAGNSAVGQTLRNEGEDVALALGERVD